MGRRRWRLFPSHPSAGCGWNQHRIEHLKQFLFSALRGQRNRLQLEGPGSPCVMRSSKDPSVRGTSTALSSSRVRHTDPTRGARTILQGARVQGPARAFSSVVNEMENVKRKTHRPPTKGDTRNGLSQKLSQNHTFCYLF